MSSKEEVVEAESVARHEIEDVLHKDLYPGTEVMADSTASRMDSWKKMILLLTE